MSASCVVPNEQQLRGGLYGLLVGDALGVPYEFHPPESLPPKDQLEMAPPPGFSRAHASVAPGTWSDDGAQALCLLASLQHVGRLDLADFSQRLLNWASLGYMAVGYEVFDIGIATQSALSRLRAGAAPHASGGRDVYSNGNGSLMRVLPLALWHRGSDAELIADAMAQSLPTHGHLRSQLCCALYCLWARALIAGAEGEAWQQAVETMSNVVSKNANWAEEWQEIRQAADVATPHGTGYVLDSLLSARAALEAPDYESAVKQAIAFGNDTDTTACIAGGLAGIRWGFDGIPERWRRALRGRELLEPLLEQLLGR